MQRKHSIYLSLKTIHLSLKTIELSLKTNELSLKTNELSLKTNSAFLQERLSILICIWFNSFMLTVIHKRFKRTDNIFR